MSMEQRCLSRRIEVRTTAGKPVVIEGYAAVFFSESNPSGTQFELWRNCYERFMPGAFDGVLSRPDDVRCLFNHNPHTIFGRTKSGTLSLSVDAIGLRFSCKLPDAEFARSVAESIRRGDVSGCSLAMRVDGQNWRDVGDISYREIEDVTLFDVGPVTFPAYTGTDVAIAKRSFEHRLTGRPTGPAPKITLVALERRHRLQRALNG